MLAFVKKSHIELSIHGERVEELLAWIRKKYDVAVLSADGSEDSIPAEETEFWNEMEKNRIGNLIAGTRLKAGFAQTDLARKLGIRQNMVSDYERGRRNLSEVMAKRFSKVLNVREERFMYGGEQPAEQS